MKKNTPKPRYKKFRAWAVVDTRATTKPEYICEDGHQRPCIYMVKAWADSNVENRHLRAYPDWDGRPKVYRVEPVTVVFDT